MPSFHTATGQTDSLLTHLSSGEDVTARNQAEADLRYSEERYRDVTEATAGIVWEMNENFNITHISEKVREVLGYGPEEIVGKNPIFLIDNVDRKRIEDDMKLLIDNPKPDKSIEFWCRKKDGIRVRLSTSRIGKFTSEGSFLGARGTHVDVTANYWASQHKEVLYQIHKLGTENDENISALMCKACAEFTDSEISFFGMIEPDGAAMISHVWSPGAMATCRIPEKPLRFPIESAGIWADPIRQRQTVIFNDYPSTKGKRGLPDGHLPLTRYLGVPIIEGDRVVALAGVANKKTPYVDQDIEHLNLLVTSLVDLLATRQKDKMLQESESRLSTALQMGKMGHWEYDVDKGIFTFSDEFYTLFRTTAEEMGGYTMSSERYAELFVHPEDRWMVANETQKAIDTSGPAFSNTVEHRVNFADGESGHVAVRFQIVKDHNNRTVKTFGVNQDITLRKQLEAEQIKAANLESIGVLAGGIAHDFNNILTAAIGNLQLARVLYPENTKVLETIEEADKALFRARDLTQQQLTFSKGGSPVKEIHSLPKLIKEAVGFSLRGSNVSCRHYFPDDLWHCNIDLGQISQVIQNLVINADQAMPNGGVITVKAENVTIDKTDSVALEAGPYVKLAIKDQGHGIPQENLERIFEPYFTTKQKGSGLGLATCYSIIKRHGGDISVESEQNKGTTFLIYLPAVEGEIEKKEDKADIKEGATGRILVMDDEKPIQGIVSKLLGALGHEVELAEKGTQAIKAFKIAREVGRPFDAVILDCMSSEHVGQ